jgi:hypothetical protein
MGYPEDGSAYTSTSALVGLFCGPTSERKDLQTVCIVKTAELGWLVIKTLEDVDYDLWIKTVQREEQEVKDAAYRQEQKARGWKDERLEQLALDCMAEGLQVWCTGTNGTEPMSWFYVTDGKGIAHVTIGSYGFLEVITEHVPAQNIGSGFKYATTEDKETAEITVDIVKKAMYCTAPSWANASDRANVRKFGSWEKYAKAQEKWKAIGHVLFQY